MITTRGHAMELRLSPYRRLTHLTAWPTGVPTNLLSEFRLYDWRSIFPDISLFYSISLDVSQQISSSQYKPELDYIKQIKTGNQMLW